MMRITNNMMVENTIRSINDNARRLVKAQERMTTQSNIQLPSDDPVTATRILKYRNYVANVEQSQKNVDDAISWQEVTESALGDLGDVIKRLKELTVQANNGTLTDEDKQKLKVEVGQLKEDVIQIMNTSYAGRYVFGGFTTDEEPYESASTTLGDKVTFKGQYMNLGGPMSASVSDTDIIDFCTANADQIYQNNGPQSIKYNIGYGSQITVNIEGQNVIGEGNGSNLFDTIDLLLLGLDGETSYKTAEITTDPTTVIVQTNELDLDAVLTGLNQELDRVLTERSFLGARMSYLDMTKDRLSNDVITYTKLLSTSEDVDAAEASIELSTSQYVYEASLSVGAKVISKSLVDYLR